MNLKIAGLLTYSERTVPKSLTLFSPGVNAFFGDNGSGKSYFLENLLDFLLGHRNSLGGLILRFSDIYVWMEEEGSDYRATRLVQKMNVLGNRQAMTKLLLETEYVDPEEDFWDYPPAFPETFESIPATETNLEILQEVADHGYVLLEPLGRTPVAWQVWPFAFPTSDTPALQSEVEAWDEFFATASLIDDAWGEDEDENDRLRGQLEDEWHARTHLHASLLANSKTARILNFAKKSVGYDAAGAAFLRTLGQVQVGFTSGVYVDGIESRLVQQVPNTDIETMTTQVIDSVVQASSEGDENSVDSVAAEVHQVASFLSLAAREVLGHLLIDPIPIELRIGDKTQIWTGSPFEWGYEEGHEFIPLGDLSAAQRRWSTFAIYLTLHSWLREHRPPWLDAEPNTEIWFFDEPERGLHRQAEEHLARGLPTLAGRFDAQVFLATHSPEIIDHPDVSTFHTKRTKKDLFTAQVQRIDANQNSSLATLGLRPSDLLNRVNLFVLVEGEHEKVLFEAFFGTEFAQHRIQLLVARGASNFDGIFDSQLITRFSDARVLLTIDHQNASEIQAIWTRAQELNTTTGVVGAQEFLKEQLPAGRKAENKFLREFMISAIRSNQLSRINIFGFTREDIIEYLPVREFAARDSWKELRQEWRDSGSNLQFKPWMVKVHQSKFDPANLRLAAMNMDEVPKEFGDFVSLAIALADRSLQDLSMSDLEEPS